MKDIFAKRRQIYYQNNLKYLRYVFNDHFVLFLLIMLAFLAVQYANFLQHNQLVLGIRLAILVIVGLASLFFGKVASFMEEADSTFLLVKEAEVKKYLLACENQSLVFPAIIYLVLLVILAPLLKISFIWLILSFIILVLLKKLIYILTFRKYYQSGLLDWSGLIQYEERRQIAILKIFALFTNVKGLKSPAHRRKYLDFLIPKRNASASEYLSWRTFFRTSDYFTMTLRLGIIALLAIVFIRDLRIAMVVSLALNYLLVFQVLALRESHQFHPLLKIYPKKAAEAVKGVKKVVSRLLLVLIVIESLVMLVVSLVQQAEVINFAEVLIFALIAILLFNLYINYRLKVKK